MKNMFLFFFLEKSRASWILAYVLLCGIPNSTRKCTVSPRPVKWFVNNFTRSVAAYGPLLPNDTCFQPYKVIPLKK